MKLNWCIFILFLSKIVFDVIHLCVGNGREQQRIINSRAHHILFLFASHSYSSWYFPGKVRMHFIWKVYQKAVLLISKLDAKYDVLFPYEIQYLNFTACLDIEAVKNDLFKAENQGDVEAILEKHSENFDEDSFSLEDRLPLIDECFKVCIFHLD